MGVLRHSGSLLLSNWIQLGFVLSLILLDLCSIMWGFDSLYVIFRFDLQYSQIQFGDSLVYQGLVCAKLQIPFPNFFVLSYFQLNWGFVCLLAFNFELNQCWISGLITFWLITFLVAYIFALLAIHYNRICIQDLYTHLTFQYFQSHLFSINVLQICFFLVPAHTLNTMHGLQVCSFLASDNPDYM